MYSLFCFICIVNKCRNVQDARQRRKNVNLMATHASGSEMIHLNIVNYAETFALIR